MAKRRLDDPDLQLADLLTAWPETIAVFHWHRMLCVGCLIGPYHTIMGCCRKCELEEGAFLAELAGAARDT